MKSRLLLWGALPVALLFTGISFKPGKKKRPKAVMKPASEAATPARAKPITPGAYKIVIDKSDYELKVYDNEGWLTTYPVVFGNKDQSDKRMSGDRLTPNGTFKITSKRSPYKWQAILVLDYPTKDSWAKFKRRQASGEIPAGASIGGGIAIHGTWPDNDWVVDNYVNWTEGCISMKNEDVKELYSMLGVGTTVTIQQ
jgi:lipoprotein-anchoring transpeptidase ErfK/SrfK